MKATRTAVEMVKSLFQAFGRGDLAYIIERVTPDCTWVAPGGNGIPCAGTYNGPLGVAQFFQRVIDTEEFLSFQPSEYFSDEAGNVVALGTESSRSRITGKQMKTNWSMVFRVRNGKVAAWESYFDTAAYHLAHQK